MIIIIIKRDITVRYILLLDVIIITNILQKRKEKDPYCAMYIL